MNQPKFQIINAAAGSGKTFSLVLRYLERLLGSNQASPHRSLLALTFTNKAVNEVKARILEQLYVLSTEPEKATVILEELLKRLNLTTPQIQDRAEHVLRKIVQEYASFDIITLDTFTHRIIRTFAKDFKLPFGFEVAVDPKEMLSDMVVSIIDRVGKDPEITETLCAFSLYKVHNNLSSNIQEDLLDFANILLEENNRIPLTELKSKTSAVLSEDKKYLKVVFKTLKAEVVQMASEALDFITKNGLEKRDFSSGTLYAHFEKIKALQLKDRYKNQLALALEGEKKLYAKTLDPKKQDLIEGIREGLYSHYLNLKAKVGRVLLTESILKDWTPLSLIHVMEKSLEALQNEQQRMLLAQFNAKIAAEIVDQPAPFIYERLGERYRHYFIDEFQDTSELQWKNLDPLIANALETEELDGVGGSLVLVGDPKQAIYRWRGGNSSQFLSLLDGQSPFQIDPKIENPLKNYRSKDAIIQFNNIFFKCAGDYLQDPISRTFFSQGSQQITNDSPGGFVQVDFIPITDKKEEANPYYLLKTLEAVKKAHLKGYKYKEIAVLVRNNKQAAYIGECLSKEGIQILSSQSLLLMESPTIQFLITLFRLTSHSNDPQQHKIILDHLWQSINIPEQDYHTFIDSNLKIPTQKLFTDFGLNFNFDLFKESTLFNALEMAISSFPFIEKNDTYVVYFLENVFEFSNSNSTTFSDYLNYWEQQSDTIHIAMPEGLDAVQIMTIHKAKGLEFPVVILPFLDTLFQPKVNYKIWVPLKEEPLKRLGWGRVGFSKKLMEIGGDVTKLYDTEILKNEQDAYTVLYVAMTRAEEELYVITSHLANEKRSYAYLFQLFAEDQGFDIHLNSSFQWGEDKRANQKSKKEDQSKSIPLSLSLNSSSNWQERLITQFDIAIEHTRNEREWGILIHQLLREIRHADGLDLALQETLESGLIQENEVAVFKALLKKVIYHPALYAFFSTQGKIFNEHDILVPNGITLRPDRVVVLDDLIVLIDYKTGSPKEKDKKQLEEYAAVIQQIGFTSIDKYLVYIQKEVSVVRV